MQDLQAREQTIARLLAKGVSAEEIAQLAADDAAHQARLLARAQIKRVQDAAPTAKAARTPASKRTTTAPTTPQLRPAPSAATTTPPPPASLVPPGLLHLSLLSLTNPALPHFPWSRETSPALY
jgi:hypothetical protein